MIQRNRDTQEEYNRDNKFLEINFNPCKYEKFSIQNNPLSLHNFDV